MWGTAAIGRPAERMLGPLLIDRLIDRLVDAAHKAGEGFLASYVFLRIEP
jgi:hypothetical protein